MTISWAVERLHIVNDPQPNTVQIVTLRASEGDFSECCDVKLGPPGETFVAYDDLDEATVLSWALPLAPVARMTENLAAAAQRATQEPASAALPWAPPEEGPQ